MTARQGGFGLIEVLVTLVILMVGLLGLAGVNARANLSEMESYQRTQALQLVQDMADRLNANRKVASCYSNGGNGIQVGTGATTIAACAAGSAQQQAQAQADLAAWDSMLKGAAETQGSTKVGAMIGAVGCVTLDDAANNVYMIAVSWQGLAKTVAPKLNGAAPFPCGNGSYGDEMLHRVVTTKVRIGALS
ncbi:MAG TPA: type IV pilus modification protein PilV [Burkholderiaceae bacterium]|nr:type IV pilus modification protein PilV [Burkholderiaceae bacterium]